VVISPDGRRALSVSQDRTVRLWDVETGKELGCFDQHTEEIFTVALSPDGRRAVSSSADKTMRLWEVDKGKVLHQLPGAKAKASKADEAAQVRAVIDKAVLNGNRGWASMNGQIQDMDRQTTAVLKEDLYVRSS
jgi:WD40 repeat protein